MRGVVLTGASTLSAGCDALFVQVLDGHPPVDRVHVGASYVRKVCVDLLDVA